MTTETLRAICISAAILSLATLFLPERESIKKASLSAFSLLFLLILFPKGDSFSMEDFLHLSDAPTVEAGTAYEDTLLAAAKEGFVTDLCDRFSLAPDAITVEGDFSLKDGVLSFDRLSIYLADENFFADAHSLLRYIEKNYTDNCEVHFVGA